MLQMVRLRSFLFSVGLRRPSDSVSNMKKVSPKSVNKMIDLFVEVYCGFHKNGVSYYIIEIVCQRETKYS